MNPTPEQLEIIEWMSRRPPVRWATLPLHWKPVVRKMVNRWPADELPWIEKHDVVMLRITKLGRMLAAAYRIGRAAAPIGEKDEAAE